MDRCALMIDAGYVYAAGGMLCCGTRSRADLVLKPENLLLRLAVMAERATKVPVLRTYWYDAARDGVRTAEQRDIAALDDVKLRLGRLSGQGQQKGVDALIYRDMITLAQQRSVSDIVLLSGDEDLREGVRTAQDYGVRVVLVGIKADRGSNQSEELVFEADRLWTLDKVHLSDFFEHRGSAVSTLAAADVATTTELAKKTAADFATTWLRDAVEAEVLELRTSAPRIPRPLDIELLITVESKIGVSLRDHPDIKRDVRATWWGVIGGTSRLGALVQTGN